MKSELFTSLLLEMERRTCTTPEVAVIGAAVRVMAASSATPTPNRAKLNSDILAACDGCDLLWLCRKKPAHNTRQQFVLLLCFSVPHCSLLIGGEGGCDGDDDGDDDNRTSKR